MKVRCVPRSSLVALAAATLVLAGCGHAPSPVAAPGLPGGVDALADNLANPTPITIPQALRDEAAAGQKLIGKPLAFKDDAEEDAYLASLVQSLPPSAYDRAGFLTKLGLPTPFAAGRMDASTLQAVLKIKGYRPGTLVNGKEILPQVMAWDIAANHPSVFLHLIPATNASVEAYSRERALWREPFQAAGMPQSTMQTVALRYSSALAAHQKPKPATYRLKFDDDVHAGLPADPHADSFSYGTYTIARQLGFTPDQATRLAKGCDGIDWDTTPYGHTSFDPMGQMDRHFNLDRQGQDTRLVWAQRHLDAACNFARMQAFDQAETELGCGMHSLQDLFAHGQLTPSMHGVIGEFPDQVTYNPVGLFEATQATKAYLHAYLATITSPVGLTSAAPNLLVPPVPPQSTSPASIQGAR